MRFHMEFGVDNAAFSDGHRRDESARILEDAARRLRDGEGRGIIHDLNGNRIGDWAFVTTAREDAEEAGAEA